MDFSLTDEQRALKEAARAFAQKELAPLAAELEAKNHPLPHDVVTKMAEMGFLGIIVVPAGGFVKLMEAFDLERCGNATMALAQASGALEDVLAYVQERQQFGKPLADFQAIQLKLAEMQMEVEAARLLIWRAAVNADKGLPSILDSSTTKCFANQIARSVTGNAVQMMGGYGYSAQYPMERRMRDAWGWGIAGGAIDIQKINIASAMVGRRFDQRR